MPTGARRPFSEIVEAAQTELIRESASGVRGKYMGAVNQAYINDVSVQLPENYIRKLAFITLASAYSAGTITVTSGGNSIVGTGMTWTTAMNDSYINPAGYNGLYRVTITNATALTLNSSLGFVGASGSGINYTLIQDRYALPSDFSYMAKDNPEYPNIVYYYVNGYKVFLKPITGEQLDRTIVPTTSTFFAEYAVKYTVGSGTAIGTQVPYLHVWPFPLNTDNIGFFYIPIFTAMTEYTTGTATFTTGTAVTGSGTLWTTISTANTYFIRNDADGKASASIWTQVSSFVSDTSITLTGNFSGTSGTGITYTISQISQWPARFDAAILYKTCLILEPDNVQAPKWTNLYQEAIGLDKTVESKRRRDSQFKSFFGLRQ